MSKTMTKEEFAAMLTGREYGSEISLKESRLARNSNLVVVFGYSDDNVELRGVIDDEIGAYNGTTLNIFKGKIMREHECSCEFCAFDPSKAKKVEAQWCEVDGYSWTFKTDIPHATFEIVEDGEPFCRGIVFDASELN